MKDVLIATLFVIGGFIALFSGCLLLINSINNKSCEAVAKKLDVSYSYSFLTGCLFQINKQWIPANTLKNVNLLKEGN